VTFEEARRRLAAAARYREQARFTLDYSTRLALVETAWEFERMASIAEQPTSQAGAL
jgi:hypothetical protein